jgi:hypothetical protein
VIPFTKSVNSVKVSVTGRAHDRVNAEAMARAGQAPGPQPGPGAANMKFRFTARRPDALFLLALIVSLGVLMSTSASAADSLFSKVGISELMEGNVKLVPVGNKGASLHMSTKSPSRENKALYISDIDNFSMKDHGVHLSLKMPW